MQKEIPEFRVPYDYVLPFRPRQGFCRRCNIRPRADPSLTIRIIFKKGWTHEVDVCTECFEQAVVNSGCQVRIFSGIKSRTILGDKDYDAVRVSSFPCGLVPSDPAIFDIDVPRLIIPSGVLPFKRKEGPSK